MRQAGGGVFQLSRGTKAETIPTTQTTVMRQQKNPVPETYWSTPHCLYGTACDAA